MQQNISPLISAEQLLKIYPSENLVIVDARTGPGIKEDYAESHLETAVFADMEEQLADRKPDAADGGRHPLPEPGKFLKTLKELGIGPASHVIIYDDKKGSGAAARLWWMLRSIGHEKVQVLNGGLQAATAADFPLSSIPGNSPSNNLYEAIEWRLPLRDIDTVENAVKDADFLVIDVRDAKRYNGEVEPIDLIAGHIPGAINLPFIENMDERGFYLSPSTLKEKYEAVIKDIDPSKLIIHCGSGVTACHTILGMDYAGLPIPALYVGSWSEWSRTERPVGIIENGVEKIVKSN